jgi:hypothetical protein
LDETHGADAIGSVADAVVAETDMVGGEDDGYGSSTHRNLSGMLADVGCGAQEERQKSLHYG